MMRMRYLAVSYTHLDVYKRQEYSRYISIGAFILGARYEKIKFDYYKDDLHIDDQSRSYDNIYPVSYTHLVHNTSTNICPVIDQYLAVSTDGTIYACHTINGIKECERCV